MKYKFKMFQDIEKKVGLDPASAAMLWIPPENALPPPNNQTRYLDI